jgi:hypothetical protein
MSDAPASGRRLAMFIDLSVPIRASVPKTSDSDESRTEGAIRTH